jgi:glucokinase
MSVLAIDFGGTRTRAAWYDDAFQQITRSETPSLVSQGAEQVIERLIDTARRVIPEGEKPHTIGVAAPGPLDSKAGIIRHAKTLPGWRDVPLGQIIGDALGGVSVFIENDGNLATLAEYRLGAAQACDPTIYLTVSTGIGGGAVIGGKLFTGWSGLAIEPGHMRFRLPDGNIRRWEELASGTAIGRTALERLERSDSQSSLRSLAAVDGQAVGEAARAGDVFALQVIEEAGRWLGLGLVNLLHLFSPQAIVLGGSVSTLGDLILNPARDVIHQHILDERFLGSEFLRPAGLGEDVCLVGAALYAVEHS